jgi:hypothetical protein
LEAAAPAIFSQHTAGEADVGRVRVCHRRGNQPEKSTAQKFDHASKSLNRVEKYKVGIEVKIIFVIVLFKTRLRNREVLLRKDTYPIHNNFFNLCLYETVC